MTTINLRPGRLVARTYQPETEGGADRLVEAAIATGYTYVRKVHDDTGRWTVEVAP